VNVSGSLVASETFGRPSLRSLPMNRISNSMDQGSVDDTVDRPGGASFRDVRWA
jgi:hypothetical protein